MIPTPRNDNARIYLKWWLWQHVQAKSQEHPDTTANRATLCSTLARLFDQANTRDRACEP